MKKIKVKMINEITKFKIMKYVVEFSLAKLISKIYLVILCNWSVAFEFHIERNYKNFINIFTYWSI